MSLPVTEDTPPDMLAGSMDLKVVLPDGRSVKMSVQRGTPMMDLLVQVTTAHCLSPGDYSLQAMGDRGVLPFKPSTPIGALDTFTVKIVEKKLNAARGRAPQVPQSFLNTFRLQVHLPRSQLFVLRVTPDVTLSEIMTHICTEKNLNMDKYEFRNPGNLDEVLELDKTLGDYKLQELSMMSKGNRAHVTGLMSSADIINVKSSKQRQNSVCDSSLSSGSFGSRSGSPIPPMNAVTMPPQPPMRKKRRPAPKPPTFTENEKKEQTTGSVLISHSRESSDSSGYHEASVLSESPTHGSPAGRIDSESPPDTLPRRSKLPPSQSFTNLASIQPPPKNRLTNSVSNTSLNSNGLSRKKRAPPPPPGQHRQENKVKSSTLPTSVAEERRTPSSFRHLPPESPVEVAQAKVQSPVDSAPERIQETKASKDEVPGCLDVDVRLPPKPKPRTWTPKTPPKSPGQGSVVSSGPGGAGALNRWRNVENLSEEGDEESGDVPGTAEGGRGTPSGPGGAPTAETGLLTETSVPPREEPGPEDTREEKDENEEDSIQWEYQLPPPPTDFRDTHPASPSCTDFGTVTITPEVLEGVVEREREREREREGKGKGRPGGGEWDGGERRVAAVEEEEEGGESGGKCVSDKRFSQKKSVVMSELTNILNGKQQNLQNLKEKSLSVSNLYISDCPGKDYRKNSLSYSRSFSTEAGTCGEKVKVRTHDGDVLGNNRKLSTSNEVVCGNVAGERDDIAYRNNRNLEKSSSMECIRGQRGERITERGEEVFRKPVAPVQKKLKVAKRSASSVGTNPSNVQKRSSLEVGPGGDWEEDENINILREQFLEFLKEKKLNSELKVKSLDVIRNILPELSQGEREGREGRENSHPRVNLVINRNNERNSQGSRSEEEAKVVEVKAKVKEEEEGEREREREKKRRGEEEEEKKKRKEEETTKRYSYQGPPSINFATWGERPKTTKIIIKDEDYVTREKVTERKCEQSGRNGEVGGWQKPKEMAKKPAQIVIKKPGVLSRYEMFSALPRRKEVSSLELVQMEDEERKRRGGAGVTSGVASGVASGVTSGIRELNRVPVVCGMELKKEFKSVAKESVPTGAVPEPPPQGEAKGKHSVSVYVNGASEGDRAGAGAGAGGLKFALPKRNSAVMPVVKGFRVLEESGGSQVKVRVGGRGEEVVENGGREGAGSRGGVSLVKLKGASSGVVRQKAVSQDPRGDLLEEIRNFGGLRKLKRTAAH